MGYDMISLDLHIECEKLCTEDNGCKGYAWQINEFPNYQLNYNKPSNLCVISTISEECPINCYGPFSEDSVQPLDTDATSGSCFIKKSGM